MNTTLINGPINIIRMEGNINNIHKIIYIYMDYHLPTNRQLQCDDTAIDVQYYFAENLKNINKPIDFFLEIWPSHISTKQNIYRGRYVDEVIRYFKKNIHHKIKNKDKTLKRNESINKNIVRYHFIDIRDILKKNIYSTLTNLIENINIYSCNKTFPDIKLLNELINKLNNVYTLLHELTFNNIKYDENKISSEYKDTYSIIEYYINKILSKYENKNIKSIIIDKLHTIIKPYFDYIFKLLKDINNIIKQIKKYNISFLYLKLHDFNGIKDYNYGYQSKKLNKLVFELTELIYEIDENTLYLFSKFIDLFFLRRFLDKNYITTAITYTGGSHSIFYIKTLIQDFDFKITHYSYCKINNINDLNKIIKNAKEYEIKELLFPSILSQCSDLKNFPPNFN